MHCVSFNLSAIKHRIAPNTVAWLLTCLKFCSEAHVARLCAPLASRAPCRRSCTGRSGLDRTCCRQVIRQSTSGDHGDLQSKCSRQTRTGKAKNHNWLGHPEKPFPVGPNKWERGSQVPVPRLALLGCHLGRCSPKVSKLIFWRAPGTWHSDVPCLPQPYCLHAPVDGEGGEGGEGGGEGEGAPRVTENSCSTLPWRASHVSI